MLWKGITDPADPAQWESIVGAGRPGWHIECSVMAAAILEVPFDLHGGGSDLIFPHHSSEIAQSAGLGQPQLARHWVHVAPLLYAGEKMSKSLGNLVFAHDLLGTYEAGVIRLSLMHYHHRIGGQWQPELLEEACRLLKRVYHARAHASLQAATQLLQAVRLALDDDLNTLDVVAALHHFVQQPAALESAAAPPAIVEQTLALLGLSADEPATSGR
jgi:cysteinyl-tRNA synthetase